MVLCIICSKCGNENEEIFREEESIEILIILDSINNIGKFQKDKYDWRKHK